MFIHEELITQFDLVSERVEDNRFEPSFDAVDFNSLYALSIHKTSALYIYQRMKSLSCCLFNGKHITFFESTQKFQQFHNSFNV